MTALPEALYTPAQVRELDRRAIEDQGIAGGVLMARAGRSTWRLIRQRYPQAKRVLVLCGGGNNGGDGYVIARLAAEAGCDVDLCPLQDPAALSGDAAIAAGQALERVDAVAWDPALVESADVVVDALLGTGLDRAVEGVLATWIHALNQGSAPVVAVDVPSGLSAETGEVLGAAVKATCTLTFIGLKQGLYTGDAAEQVGERVFDDLQVPGVVYEGMTPSAWRVTSAALAQALPARPHNSHKGRFGHVLIIGGDHGMGGAVRLAGEGAARVGAGLVSVATQPGHVSAVQAARPELMTWGIASASDNRAELEALLRQANVIGLGPGLGQGQWGTSLYQAALNTECALVVDADGLNHLAAPPTERDDWVLTPHPGEAARLLATDVASIEADRFAAANALAKRYGGAVVLKGSGTIISDGQTRYVCTAGNPGMASGGMGDVLTGVIAGLRAQGLSPIDAARIGVQAHSDAADRAAAGGERGLLAGDVLAQLRGIVNP